MKKGLLFVAVFLFAVFFLKVSACADPTPFLGQSWDPGMRVAGSVCLTGYNVIGYNYYFQYLTDMPCPGNPSSLYGWTASGQMVIQSVASDGRVWFYVRQSVPSFPIYIAPPAPVQNYAPTYQDQYAYPSYRRHFQWPQLFIHRYERPHQFYRNYGYRDSAAPSRRREHGGEHRHR